MAASTSSRNARIERSWSFAVYVVPGRSTESATSSRESSSHFLRPPSSRLDVVVAVELEVPVGVGREPVVVAAVQDDGVVVGDAALGQQCLELLLAHEVAADRVLQVLLPVEADRAPDVVLVVGGGVLVDLDEDDLRVVEVGLDPVGVDEDALAGAAHADTSVCGWAVRSLGTVRTMSWDVARRSQQVDLAAEADAERRVEEGRRERGPGRHDRHAAAAARPARATSGEHQADGLREPDRSGVLELGRRAETRTDEAAVDHAVRRAAGGAESEDDGLDGEQPDTSR